MSDPRTPGAGGPPRDAGALFAEERAAAAFATPDAYQALLERRFAARPVVLNLALLETVIAERDWTDALRPFAAAALGYPPTPPSTVLLLNTFQRVPTAAAEAVLGVELGLRLGSLHPQNAYREIGFDKSVAVRELRSRSLVRGHLVASVRLRACLAMLSIRPILIVRNIFDTIASYVDDRTEPRMVAGYTLATLDPAARRRILTLRMAAQMVDFHASWWLAQRYGGPALHRWEEVRLDWPGFLADRLVEHGLTLTRDAVAAKLVALPANLRAEPAGGSILADEDRQLVRTLYAQYPEVDFRPIDPEAPAPGS